MRLVHVVTSLEAGGAEHALCRLLESTGQTSCENHVVVLAGKGPLTSRAQAAAVSVTHIGLDPRRPSLWALADIRQRISVVRPDVVHGWMYHGNVAAMLGGLRRDVPVVWGVRQSLYDISNEKRLTRLMIRTSAVISSRTSAIVYNSRLSAEQHERYGFDDSRRLIIPNGFDIDVFRPDYAKGYRLRQQFGIGDDTLVVGLAARVHPMKDHYNFLRAAAIFVSRYPNTVFLLAGQDTDRDEAIIGRDIAAYGLERSVMRCGRLDDMAEFNMALDIACLSSAWGDAFPNALGEAMACGIPCVTTNVGDAAVVVGEAGIVVPPRDPTALAAGWSRLAELGPDGRNALGARARARIIERYTLEQCSARYLELYQQVRNN